MHRSYSLSIAVFIVVLTFFSNSSFAIGLIDDFIKPVESDPFWVVQASVYTQHFHPKPHHNNHQELIGIERNRDDSYIWGGATFRNSFNQRSHYAYVGKRFDFAGTPFYSRVSMGLIHGYRGKYRNKVPFNHFGISPVILPAFGAAYKKVQADAVFLGTNAYLVTVGLRF